MADSVNSFCCIASKSQLLCYSFVFRRRDAVVSRAVWKKITDLQRVLNFRKIRIFDRFTNFTQFRDPPTILKWHKNGNGCQSLSFGAIFAVLSRTFMFFQVALARTSSIIPSKKTGGSRYFALTTLRKTHFRRFLQNRSTNFDVSRCKMIGKT